MQMAEAGFLHTPSDNCPDVAKCFFCLKKLEGWEPEDDPAYVLRVPSSLLLCFPRKSTDFNDLSL